MKVLELDNPALLDKQLSVHFVTRFLTDVIQFSFAFFVKDKNYLSKKEEDEKQ